MSVLSGASLLVRIQAVIIGVCMFAVPSFGQAKVYEVEASGLEVFWRIHALLSNDREPAQAEWDALFATPAYAAVDAKERRRKALTEILRLAYLPAKAAEREAMLQSGKGYTANLLAHFAQIPKFRKELDQFLQTDRLQKLIAEARRKAQEFLPEGTTEKTPPPPVSLFFFQSRGYPERILMDALGLMQHPNQSGLIGHEFHHHYRNKIGRKTRPFGDDNLAWAIANVEVEGVAGNVDKGDIPGLSVAELERRYRDKGDRDYARQYQVEYARSNEWLKFVEQHLVQIADAPEQRAKLGTKLHSELPDNGRAMGTFMSQVILQQFGRARFLQTVGDSFAFWWLYHEAALRTQGKAYALSVKAMNVIESVRASYQVSTVALTTIAVRVKNMQAMVAFYSEAFGAKFRPVETGSFASQFGEAAGITFKFVPIRDAADFTGFPLHQPGFNVLDVEAIIAIALKHGGRQEGQIVHDGNSVKAAVRDPDGNTIELYQSNQR